MTRTPNLEVVKILEQALAAAKAGRINAVILAGYLEPEDGDDGHAGLGFHVESPAEAEQLAKMLTVAIEGIATQFRQQEQEEPRDGMPLHP